MATDAVVAQLGDAELRFLLGREMGQAWLHHTEGAGWVLQHFTRDVVLFPLAVLGLKPKESEPAPKPKPKHGQAQHWLLLKRCLDTVADACDVFRGLRSGSWPGLADLDLGLGRLPVTRVDSAAAMCAKLKAPGGAQALVTAAAGFAVPRLAAEALDLSGTEERQLRRCLRLGTWGLGLWAAKARAEAFSADRLGLVAAEGDLEAAMRAMITAARTPQDIATAALLGTDELIRQAEYLNSVLPASYWSLQPPLHARVAQLTSWAESPVARAVLRYGQEKT